MSIPALEGLRQTLQQLRRRRRKLLLLQQASLHGMALILIALAASLLAAWWQPGRTGTTVLLLLTLLLAIMLLWHCYRRLQRQHGDDQTLAHYVEGRIPDFEQRLLTSLEFTEQDLQQGRTGVSRQFVQQLWTDAEQHLHQQQQRVVTVAPARTSWLCFASAVTMAGIAVMLFMVSEPLRKAGLELAWPFAMDEPPLIAEEFADITIEDAPGDITLVELPEVERINLAFDYPEYTGLPDLLQPDSGDMLVPEGTVVNLLVHFNKAVARATVQFGQSRGDQDEQDTPPAPYADLPLQLDGKLGTGSFTVHQDAVYRIVATDFSALESKNPLDYLIEVTPDQPPQLALQHPGGDREVMPLEEVLVQVAASDDYGLSAFTLHYSIAGTDVVEVDLLAVPNVRQVTASKLLYLEDLAVAPGDFVSYFLTVADNNAVQGPTELVSDIYFLQIIPTDQQFRRNPAMGGNQQAAGGAGSDSSALVTVQKDIIAATWKLHNRQHRVSPGELAAATEVIAVSQRQATSRARRSIDRLAERVSFADDSYEAAVRSLALAIEQMELAAQQLTRQQISTALQPQQAALRYILQAEASINRTSISMQQAGGGGSNARQEREDLRDLFEMEMGELENRYEHPDSAAGSGAQQQQVDQLEQLARRQQQLTRAQRTLARREAELSEAQKRRELERLTRQQQQLSREAAQLAQQLSGALPAPQQSSTATGQPQQQTVLQQAVQQMQQAAASDSPSLAAARSQKALDNLLRQQQQLHRQSASSVQQLVHNLGQRGQQLLAQQRRLQQAVEATGRQQGLGQTRQTARNEADLPALLETQRQQQHELQTIRQMLTTLINRSSEQDQQLLLQAQAASRELRPIQQQRQTGSRVLRDGMVHLAVDIEQQITAQMADLAASLAALDASAAETSGGQMQQAATTASTLREQLEQLQQQAEDFAAAQYTAAAGVPGPRAMREQLQRARQLVQQLQHWQHRRQGRPAERVDGEQPVDSLIRNRLHTIRQQLSRQDIDGFLQQPELFARLLAPVMELETALRARAGLDQLNHRLFATTEEEIPEQYRELVEQYYRVLAETR